MKKIISLLGALGLGSTVVSTVVSCTTPEPTKIDSEVITDLSKLISVTEISIKSDDFIQISQNFANEYDSTIYSDIIYLINSLNNTSFDAKIISGDDGSDQVVSKDLTISIVLPKDKETTSIFLTIQPTENSIYTSSATLKLTDAVY